MSKPKSEQSTAKATEILQQYALGERKFTEVDLRAANLIQVNLKGADLSYSDLSHANLSQADLRGTDLSFSNLSHTNLSQADLRGASLIGTDLRSTNLSQTQLSKADYSDATRFPEGFDPLQAEMQKQT